MGFLKGDFDYIFISKNLQECNRKSDVLNGL